MKLRQAEKIARSFRSGKRLKWKIGTRLKAFRLDGKPSQGGWMVPRYLQRPLMKAFEKAEEQ